MKQYLILIVVGIVLLASGLALEFLSFSLRIVGGVIVSVHLTYSRYGLVLSAALVGLGGFILFRAGQLRPIRSGKRPTLAEQVESVRKSTPASDSQ